MYQRTITYLEREKCQTFFACLATPIRSLRAGLVDFGAGRERDYGKEERL